MMLVGAGVGVCVCWIDGMWMVAVLCSFVVSLLLLRRYRSVGRSRVLVFLDYLTCSRVLWRLLCRCESG